MDQSTEPFLQADGLVHQEEDRSDIEPRAPSESLPSETPESRGGSFEVLEPSFLKKIWGKIYTPPRQRLGDVSNMSLDEHDETAEWEHIFLDLFYVPAISNLSEMLQGIFTSGHVNMDFDGDEWMYYTHGNLCFIAVFFSIWSTWYHNTVFVSKYVANSRFHRLMNRARLLLVAIAIFHITEAQEMEEIGNESSFYYCLGITLECALTILGRIELMLQGDARMRNDSAAVLCIVYVPRLALYAAAWLIQGHSHNWTLLVLCGSLIPSVLAVVCEYFFTMVPIDQQKYNERIGAWVSVLLGEGVIALLKSNVDTSSEERWTTVIIGLMSIMVIHSIYFYKQGSVRNSDKFKGWLQSGSIQALSIGMIGIGIFSANGPKFELMSRYIPKAKRKGYDLGTTSNITQICTAYVSGGKSRTELLSRTGFLLAPLDDGLEEIASSTKTVFPISIKRQFHLAYFDCRALILLSLELVFWTADPTRITMIKSWFRDAGSRNRALMGSLLFIQAFVIVSFPVLVHTTYMVDITPKGASLIGFASTIVFYICRVYIIEAIDGKN